MHGLKMNSGSNGHSSNHSSRGIFVRHDVKLPAKLGTLSHLRVQNEVMLVARRGREGEELQYIRLANANTTEIKLQGLADFDRVAYVHLDYNAPQAIVSTVGGENFYLNLKTGSLKHLSRLRGAVVSAVGWNPEYGKELETGFILLGTTKGALIETNISANLMTYKKIVCKNLNGGGEGGDLAITDIYLSAITQKEEPDRFCVIMCTPGRLYSMSGAINTEAIPNQQETHQQTIGTVWSVSMAATEPQPRNAVVQPLFNVPLQYHSHPGEASTPPSALAVYPLGALDALANEPPSKFAWMSSQGVSIGSINILSAAGYDMITEEAFMRHKRSEGRFDYPLDIVLTEFHLLLLHSNRIVALSLLDQSPAFEEHFGINLPGNIIGMTRDHSSQFVWVFSDCALFKYRPFEETRYVWRILLGRGKFAEARKITAQMQDPEPYQVVIKKEAEKFIAEEEHVAAAELLAQSTEPFEATVLKFLKGGQSRRNGLKRFLELKLNKVDRDKVKRDILVMWLLEIQLGELAELRRHAFPEATGASTDKRAEFKKLRDQFYCFLNRPVVSESINANKDTVYRLIASHVDFEVQLHVAQKLKDQDTVVKLLLLQRRHPSALDVLRRSASAELFYKYASELVEVVPNELVSALIECEKSLRPSNFLHIFARCFEAKSHGDADANDRLLEAAIHYLGHVVDNGCGDRSVHHFFVNLLSIHDCKELLDYLKRHVNSYDIDYALKVCLDKGADECSIFLYCAKGHFEEAVNLALNSNLELAKECAVRMNEHSSDDDHADGIFPEAVSGFAIGPELTREYRRRVWLLIAQRVIKSGVNVEGCIALLKESRGAIGIHDILVDFPDFSTIQHFKEPICSYLREQSARVKAVQEAMKAAAEATNEIKKDLERNKSKYEYHYEALRTMGL